MNIHREFMIVLCLVCFSHQKSTPESDSYRAAVLEYQFTRNTSTNLANYVRYIKEAADQHVDILVFPEMTLTRGHSVKVPMHGLLKDHIPALHPELFDDILVSLSTAARQNSIYVLVNLQETMDCKDSPGEYCPTAKTYIFNTNVVFDRTGAVISRYRKINLFGEHTRWPALRPELGVFTTDFGVTFGHFICFDLMFQVPATQLVQKHKITDVIFSTMWFSEMPFLTAVQIQEAYAYSMNVNFLAAGANNVKVGSAGSGIYSGKTGALISAMPGQPRSILLIAKVPKVPGNPSYNYPGPIYDDPTIRNQLLLNSDRTLYLETSRPLLPGFQEFTLADKGISCTFRVKIDVDAPENSTTVPKFRAFIKDGSNTYSNRKMGVALCAVVACKDDTVINCPYWFNKDETFTEFKELEITMTTYPDQYNSSLECDNVIYYPSSMRYNKFPLATQDFSYSKLSQNGVAIENQNGGREKIIYKLEKSQKELVSFAVWGRIYLRDVNPKEDVSEEDVKNYIEIENTIYSYADK